MSRRTLVYLLLRGSAALVFVLAATLMPRGVPAALVIMGAGIAAVLTCVGVNAGSAGEQRGARAQDRWFDSLRAPQGDWPPYAPDRVVDGDVVEQAAAPRRPDAA